ncbi:putative LRR receptor-like serine/threonine-protein kinase [Gossypium australe]|uniref:non-specific serine/threonine protein kinase n=1 Tax=Gossypium australe TaxID=47621 RepID=A0A5B6WBJ7_9ROSI|nr:putative LRR receptor-like serine/threonine-protein kinase [Gossypium australe]
MLTHQCIVLRNVLLTGSIPSDISDFQSLQKLFLGNNSLSGTLPSQKSEILKSMNVVANNFTLNSSDIRWTINIFQITDFYQDCSAFKEASHAIEILHDVSLAKTLASVYVVEGGLQVKDFDISKEAGGAEKAITRRFISNVTDNHLEIHLLWTGKGTCCVPELGYYGPSISAISVVPNFKPTVSGLPPGNSKRKTALIVGIAVPVGAVSLMLIYVVIHFKKRKKYDDEEVVVNDLLLNVLLAIGPRPNTFSYAELKAATEDFSPSNKLLLVIGPRPNTFSYAELKAATEDFSPSNKFFSHFIITTYSLLLFLLDSAVLLAIGPRPNTFSYAELKAATEDFMLLAIGPRPNTFSYAELKAATEDFSPSNKLGEGGYGAVYKGTLSDGRVVAVKQLSVASHKGKSQFIAEVATISAVQHRNLVKLHGCCIEGKRHLLVYEYLENKSLDKALFGRSDLRLDWPTHYNICLATARGLAYLHEESRPRIVHRDVKASNILLDAELCPKISDFGLAKLYDDKKTHISTRVAGTILDLVDPNLFEFDENEVLRIVGVALLCTQGSPSMRPPMSRVVAMLAGDIEVSGVITRPSYLTDWDFRDLTSSFVTESIQASTASEDNDNHNQNRISSGPGAAPILSPVNVSDIPEEI